MEDRKAVFNGNTLSLDVLMKIYDLKVKPIGKVGFLISNSYLTEESAINGNYEKVKNSVERENNFQESDFDFMVFREIRGGIENSVGRHFYTIQCLKEV